MSSVVSGAPDDVQEAWQALPSGLKTLISMAHRAIHTAYGIPLNAELRVADDVVRHNAAICIKYLAIKRAQQTPADEFITKRRADHE